MYTASRSSSTYYKAYGFKDWTITDDEMLYGIFSTYKYPYSSSNPTQYLRVLAIDVSDDWVWKCVDSYDISAQFGEYSESLTTGKATKFG